MSGICAPVAAAATVAPPPATSVAPIAASAILLLMISPSLSSMASHPPVPRRATYAHRPRVHSALRVLNRGMLRTGGGTLWPQCQEIEIAVESCVLCCRHSGLRLRAQEARRLAGARGLLEGVGQADQLRLAEGTAHEGDAHRQAEDVAGGHAHRRIAGERGRLGAAAEAVVAV